MRWARRTETATQAADESAAALAAVSDVASRARAGDLEARIGPLEGGPAVQQVRDDLNRLLDLVDAFVREAGASLDAAGQGRFHRRMLTRGFPGTFRRAASTINSARLGIKRASEVETHAREQREQLAQEFESMIMSVAEQVAAAATELGASAQVLAEATRTAEQEAQRARDMTEALSRASREVDGVVSQISDVAGQTKLLALNATIEAAHAGASGAGFAVVAAEVKALAEQAAEASGDISRRVQMLRASSQTALESMSEITEQVTATSRISYEIAQAVDGSSHGFDGGERVVGLAQLAELLRAEAATFLSRIRGDQ